MNKAEYFPIIMSWSGENNVSEDYDPDDFIYETSGDLFIINEKDDKEFIGKFRVYYVDVERATNEGINIFDVLDDHSSHLAEYYGPIFNSDEHDFNNHLLGLLGHEVYSGNILVLDRLEILPQYRGKKLGLIILRNAIARFSSGAGLVAMKPFPLQFEVKPSGETQKKWRDRMSLAQKSIDQDIATNTLCNYYSKLGFIKITGTPMMIISTTRLLPTIKEILQDI